MYHFKSRTKAGFSSVIATIICTSLLVSCGGGSDDTVTQAPSEPPASTPNTPTLALPTGISIVAGTLAWWPNYTASSNAAYFGNVDGIGENARFTFAKAIAVGQNGDTYVIEGNSLRKVDATGKVTTIDTQIGSGHTAPSINAITSDTAGNVYLALGSPSSYVIGSQLVDSGLFHSSIRKIAPDGKVTMVAGPSDVGAADRIGSTDGKAEAARFNEPNGIVADKVGNLYVTDTRNRTVRKITPDGIVTTIAGKVTVLGNNNPIDGPREVAEFGLFLTAITIDSLGNLYVADEVSGAPFGGLVRKITPDGVTTTVFGRAGFFRGLAVDGSNNVYLSDSYNGVTKATPGGTVTTLSWGNSDFFTATPLGVAGPFAFVAPNAFMMAVPGAVLRVTLP